MAQETEVTKTVERTPVNLWVENRDGRFQIQMAHRGEGSSFCIAVINHWADDAEALAQFIVTACNAYGPMREALEPIYEKTNFVRKHSGDEISDNHFFGGGLTWGDIRALRRSYDAAVPTGNHETAWLIERSTERGPCWWGQDDGEHAWTHDHMQARRYCSKEDAERDASDMGLDDWFVCEHAWTELSTLPSNDARSDEIGRLRECERVLRIIMEDPRGRGIDPEHRRQARAALNGVSQPATSTASDPLMKETAALVALAEANIPTDVQELLMRGNPDRDVAPGALRKACEAYGAALDGGKK